ncbi:MAG: FHA domain-containing protein [Clostridiales bacterium]|nr:FHA domain-containing protein [Clostridiales bacterium]
MILLETLEYFMRYVLSALAIVVILNCVWSLVRVKPQRKIYAVLVDMGNKREYPLTMYENSIGRKKSCDIVFDNTTVSRGHAVIALRRDGFYVFDTESKSGVYVNSEKIERKAKIKNDDVIAFGTAIMKFYVGNEATGDISQKKNKEDIRPCLINLADNTVFNIDSNYITMGRAKGSNVEMSAPYISRTHASIEKIDGKWILKDYGSVQPTLLNKKKVPGQIVLKYGDIISIGDYGFKFEKQ